LHRHFKGREELMTALALRAMADLDAAFEAAAKDAPSWTEALRLGLGAMIPLASRTVFLDNEPLEHVPALRAETARQRAEMIEAIKEAQAEGGLALDVPAVWIAEAFDGLIYAAWTMVRDEEATPRQAADLAWRTLTAGVGGAK
jgi:AcrR family transcriptional regulator